MNIPKISRNININYSNINAGTNNIAFCGIPVKQESKFFKPVKKMFEKPIRTYKNFVERIAKSVGRLLQNQKVYNLIESSKKNKNLFNHLMTAGSVVLSSFYVIRTLGNKKLEDKKKNTLAINQTLVFGLSTASCYLVEGKIKAKVSAFANKFEAVNSKFMADYADLLKLKKGIDPASKIVVFDMIFRFITPVFITPIANHIGNKMNEKQEAELANTELRLKK